MDDLGNKIIMGVSLGSERTVLLPTAGCHEVGLLHIVEEGLGGAVVQLVLEGFTETT